MRIIAGECKGRVLNTPKNNQIRPTTDKVKEALFSMITAFLQDSIVIDLFAGSGNLGLEAISRGAKRCYFGDYSKESLTLLKRNIALCRAESKSVVIAGDYMKVLTAILEKADIIFLDPPYQKNLLLSCLHAISEKELLNEEGIIVAEHGKTECLPEHIGPFSKIKEKKYGTIIVSLYGFNK